MKNLEKKCACIMLIHTIIYFGVIIFIKNPQYQIIIGDILCVLGLFIGTAFGALGIRVYKHERIKLFWQLIFLGSLSNLIGEALWSYYDIFIEEGVPFIGLFDVFYYLQILFLMSAIVYKCYIKSEVYKTIKFLFDIIIVMSVIITLSLNFIIFPILQSPNENLFNLVSIGYAIGDLVILFGVLSLYFNPNHILSRKSIVLLISSLMFQALGDTMYMWETIYGGYFSGAYFDPLWTLASMVMGYASLLKIEQCKKTENQTHEEYAWFLSSNSTKIKILVPYISIILLLFIILYQYEGKGILFIGFCFSIVLVLIRQIATLFENQSLLKKLYEFNKELEKKVEERTAQLMNSNRFKSEIISTMSHELRTPIHGILSYVQLIQDGIDGPVTEEVNEDLKIVERSTKRLLLIIDNMMNLSKIENKKEKVQIKEVKIDEIINSICKELLYLAKEKELELVIQIENQDTKVISDSLKIEIIITNLLMNAIKFTSQGYVKVGYKVENGYFYIWVEDTGIGISKEYHDYIFEKFTQLDSGNKRKYAGAGLGLPIVKGIVTSLGGEIYLESTVGVGSKFMVKIPRNFE